ncbi:UDP-glucuronic acid decarboxylase 2 [Dichanthelium oligosanthes]|uniref:UDP-glucuronate decarboxylase n=1 Tax=Dichanthelium oligosanthes TaxID=888268 RepID=A0A1E5V510_9POAL|nr:UDP-glucuronic acid decarboxylase 2 [Dichanthelium oligosanthes]
MASELTYRGGAAAHGSASNGGEYSPKPSKPLSWLSRAARYAAAEHRPVFALAGMLFAAALFTFSSSSTSDTSSPSYPAGSAGFNRLAVAGHPSFRESVGGKVPLGLRRRVLRVLVTGGAGFVGSHLVDRLVERGDSVIVVDNFFTGRKGNVAHHLQNPRFEVIRHDVVEPILLEVDQIYHLACPASPVHYKFHFFSKSFTNANTSVLLIGVRSCYDEGKRTAETLTMDYHRGANLEVRIARIFNTYGPRMCIDDGRVVSNFVAQALRKEPLTVYGDGKQTRSFQYVSDLVEGLMKLMEGEHIGPFNLGNPGEFTMLELAKVVQDTIDPEARIEFRPNTADDPHKRKPDISRAKELLGWEPKVPLHEGLPLMVTDFRKRIFGDQEESTEAAGGLS